MPVYAAPLVVPALARHTATVVFLHGLGDSGAGWENAVHSWRRHEQLSGVKFILPHAPSIPITANSGYQMPAWFDVKAFGGTNLEFKRKHEDESSVLATTDYVHSIIQGEVDNGIPADRIVLGGFSQGGSVGIVSGLTFKSKLAGILALSSFLPLSLRLPTLVPQPELNKQTPILMAHGDADQVISLGIAKESHEVLKHQGYDSTLKVYPGMPHSTSPQEMIDVVAFLSERLPSLDKEVSGKLEL